MKNKNFLKLLILLLLILGFANISIAENLTIRADKQNYNEQSGLTTFEGNVNVKMNDIRAKSPLAKVKFDSKGNPTEAELLNGAYASKESNGNKSEIKSEIIRINLVKNHISAGTGVVSQVSEKGVPTVTIISNTQEYDMENNVMTASGSVKINYKDLETLSDKANVDINEKGNMERVRLSGNAQVIQKKSIVKADKFNFISATNEIVALGNTYTQSLLDDGSKVYIWSDFQQYDKNSNTLMTSGSVKINYKNYTATGPKASLLPDKKTNEANKVIFLGRSKIKEDDKVVEADRITITMNPKNFTAEGNVKTQITQVKKQTSSTTTTTKKKAPPKGQKYASYDE